MLEFIILMAILFGGGMALGVVTGRRSWMALPLAVVAAVIAGISAGEWSGYRTMFARWDVFLYASVSILSYFAFAIAPAVAGAVAGILIRRSCCASHKKDATS